jgi:hydrogenase nickel incorporation protein HypA/HybF
MHEYSIVTSLIATAEARAREHGATAIHRLALRIGELSGVEADLLSSAFELARTGTLCADASLEVERVPVTWACRACGTPISPGAVLRCPACGAPARLVSGDEIVLAQMELEVADV